MSSTPYILPDGTIMAADKRSYAAFDGSNLAVKNCGVIGSNAGERPKRFQPSFGQTGEIYLVTSEESAIRGLKDGGEIMKLLESCEISLPVMLSDDTIAFVRADGAVRRIGTDGILLAQILGNHCAIEGIAFLAQNQAFHC
ncbi:MAG: hypothetical protein AB2L14_33000 [Candidatus Xenobiia bacterium LiM19]